MQAAIIHQWGNASQFEVTEVPQPIVGNGEVLVKISFAALNPIDYKMRNGRFKWFMSRKFPKILGLEASGHVEALGNGVDGLQVGDPVFIHPSKQFRLGCYAQYNTIPSMQIKCFGCPQVLISFKVRHSRLRLLPRCRYCAIMEK
jgi:NADPH:quinone reductase-like Zn-dependent oxidoreductase